MFELNGYLHDLISCCRASFGDRLLYVGLQGSYLRGEAHEGSDIDVMVILDRFSVGDMVHFAVFDKICSRLMKLKRDAFVHTLAANIQHPFVIKRPHVDT